MYRGDPTTGAPFIFLTEPPVTPTSPAGPGYQDLNKTDGSGHLKPHPTLTPTNPPYNSQPGLASQGVKPKVPEANIGKAEISIDLPACLPLSPPLYNCAANYAASLATRPALSRLENQEIFLFFRLVFLFFFFFAAFSYIESELCVVEPYFIFIRSFV